MAVGTGVIRGMAITLRHFVDTYIIGANEQPAAAGDLPQPAVGITGGMPMDTGGIFTVQYPEQKLPIPERFRAIPFLLYEEDPAGERGAFDGVRCTACGICAKVCPPQCIWIVQGKGDDGRPRPVATEFYIDASICMSCGFCAEYCPFDAIKMDHEFEISTYERHESWVYDIEELLHPVEYHAAIHPTDYAREVEEARVKAEAQAKKEAAKAQAATGASEEDLEELKRKKAEARRKFLESRGKSSDDAAG
jgi:NADH-quinone oxidoreductase subunit I